MSFVAFLVVVADEISRAWIKAMEDAVDLLAKLGGLETVSPEDGFSLPEGAFFGGESGWDESQAEEMEGSDVW